MAIADESREIDTVVDRICARFPGLTTAEVRAKVQQALDDYEDVPVRDFVPVLIENTVTDEYRTLRHDHPEVVAPGTVSSASETP